MRSLNSRSFLWQWRSIYASSNPSQVGDRWEVDGVSWSRERHNYWSGRYSVQLEIHWLEHGQGDRPDWKLMVVTERWWGPARDTCIRDTTWCKLVNGRADRVWDWLRTQEGRGPRPAGARRDVVAQRH